MVISEKELKILINTEGGKALIRQLAEIEKIDEYSFGLSQNQQIEDLYLDSPDFTLKINNSYLRLRGREGLHTITFRKEIIEGDEVEVNEIHHPLDDQGVLLMIQEVLRSKWIKGTPNLFKPTFIEVLQSIGLFEQLRVNINRIIRDLFIEDIKIGKIKIDEFYYQSRKNELYYMIELNTYKKAYHMPINNFFRTLGDKYGYRLELTSINKYNRGMETLR